MLRFTTSFAAILGVVVLAGDLASGQIIGPARRAAAGAAAGLGAPGVGARIESREAARGITPGDRWRYINHGNQWWYYTPQNNWMYYQNNAWAPYDSATYTGAIPAAPMVPAGYGSNTDPNAWRYVYNNDRWWYYTPQHSWMYYGENQWLPFQAGANANLQYRTGYRGNYGAAANAPLPPPVNQAAPAERQNTFNGGAAVQDPRNLPPSSTQQPQQPSGTRPDRSINNQPRDLQPPPTPSNQPQATQPPRSNQAPQPQPSEPKTNVAPAP